MASTGAIEGDPQALLARVAQVTDDGLAIVRSEQIEWTNDALSTIFGRAAEELIGAHLAALRIEELRSDHEHRLLDLGSLLEDGSVTRMGRVVAADGPARAVAVSAVRLDLAQRRWLLTFRSVTDQMRAYEDLRASEAQFRALATNAPIGVFQSDHGVRLGYLNPHFAELWGRSGDQLEGVGWLDAIHADDRPEVLAALAQCLAGDEVSTSFRVEREAADLRIVEARVVPVVRGDRSIGFVGSIEDVTALRHHEAQLEWQATHDPLTGLANRAELQRRIAASAENPHGTALLFFDLDDFKVVNDSLGHEAGDHLLCTVAERLSAAMRTDDMIARFGGDEFVVLCRGIERDDMAIDVARRLRAELEAPIRLLGHRVRITTSVGIVVARGSVTPETLLRDADVAMYQAKQAGKDRIAIFDERERVRVEQHLEIVNGLRQALGLGHVGVAYQPIVRAADRRIIGAEALLRFVHPTLGPIGALDVITLAERSGCIVDLGANVLTSACRDLAWWRRERPREAPDYVAVNLAAVQLEEDDLVEQVASRLDRFGLAPQNLCLELTESQLMSDAARGDLVLSELHRLGVRIAIDDFGTGYSSLAYLSRFPTDVVKLDRSFVAGVPSDPATAAIIRAIVSLTDTFGFSVAAEGVETAAQLDGVVDLGCDLLQGFGLGQPVPPEQFPLEAQWP